MRILQTSQDAAYIAAPPQRNTGPCENEKFLFTAAKVWYKITALQYMV
jgi:hypothetical protein